MPPRMHPSSRPPTLHRTRGFAVLGARSTLTYVAFESSSSRMPDSLANRPDPRPAAFLSRLECPFLGVPSARRGVVDTRVSRSLPKAYLSDGWRSPEQSVFAPRCLPAQRRSATQGCCGACREVWGPGVEASESPNYKRETERHWMECLVAFLPLSHLGRPYLPCGAVRVTISARE